MRTLHFCLVVSSSFFFFPRLILAVSGCLPYIYTWCGPSANLECRSEMCCMQLAGNAGPENSPKIRHLGTIAQLCRAMSSQLRHLSPIGKKTVKQQCLPHMFSQYGELRLRSVGKYGAPQQISTGFASWLPYCSDVIHRRPAKLCTMFGCLLGWYTMYYYSTSVKSVISWNH